MTVEKKTSFEKLLLKDRSFRGFDSTCKIEKESLLRLVELTRLCPSSANKQPLKFAVTCDEDTVKKILAETKWAGYLKELDLPKPGEWPTAFITVCHDTDIDPNVSGFQKDVGIVSEVILLGASEMGLGGCMIGSFNAGAVSAVLALSDNLKPQLVIALGKPTETVMLTDASGGNTVYWRDENGVHYVPKRPLSEIVID